MIHPVRSFLQLPIRWQIGALLVATQLIAHVFTWGLFLKVWTGDNIGPVAVAAELVAPLSTIVGLIDRMPEIETQLVEAAIANNQRLKILPSFSATQQPKTSRPSGVFLAATRGSVPPGWKERIAVSADDGVPMWNSEPKFFVAAHLSSGRWLAFAPPRDGIWRTLPSLFALFAVALLALPWAAAAFWAGSALVAPLGSLAAAAKRFGSDLDSPPAVENGPAEVRAAARIFNDMRERIKKLVEGRGRMMAAIGHDLRTPLTRMRLRIESVEDETIRKHLLDDVGEMKTMINSALSYIRDHEAPTTLVMVDLAALTETICYEFSEQGANVVYVGPPRLAFPCDSDLMRRAISNLIDNSVKYADGAVVRLSDSKPRGITISVEDSGPGIPAERQQLMLEPFQRGDASRNNFDNSGFGLGLSIAKDFVERHGGSLSLRSNLPHGLVVSIALPPT